MENNNIDIFYGFVPSELDGNELVIDDCINESLPIPEKYTYMQYMSPILDQGAESTCVPHAISAAYDYYFAMKNPNSNEGQFKNTNIAIHQIYNSRSNSGDGMTYKEALEFCKNEGVVNATAYRKKDYSNPLKITDYARINSLYAMKYSLIANGPCVIATFVKNPNADDFWNGYGNYGGHATCIIGYDDHEKGLLLRNSWGRSFGNNGYTWLPYKEFNRILEAWAIIA